VILQKTLIVGEKAANLGPGLVINEEKNETEEVSVKRKNGDWDATVFSIKD
jgi:hypothetical protein